MSYAVHCQNKWSATDRDGIVPAGVLVQRRLQHADGVRVLVGLQDAHLREAQLRQRLLLVQSVCLHASAVFNNNTQLCQQTVEPSTMQAVLVALKFEARSGSIGIRI